MCPALYERSFIVNGVSKAYSMTGWRIGYACGAAEVIHAMRKIQSHSTSNPTSIAQDAAEAALTQSQDFATKLNAAFEERHTRIYELLRELPGVKCQPAEGSFYIFPDFSQAIAAHNDIKDDLALAEHLLETVHVATVPGIAFGMPGHLRLSFSTDLKSIETGIARIRETLEI